jgi:hypothetical protein
MGYYFFNEYAFEAFKPGELRFMSEYPPLAGQMEEEVAIMVWETFVVFVGLSRHRELVRDSAMTTCDKKFS